MRLLFVHLALLALFVCLIRPAVPEPTPGLQPSAWTSFDSSSDVTVLPACLDAVVAIGVRALRTPPEPDTPTWESSPTYDAEIQSSRLSIRMPLPEGGFKTARFKVDRDNSSARLLGWTKDELEIAFQPKGADAERRGWVHWGDAVPNNWIALVDAQTGQLQGRAPVLGSFDSIAFSPDGSRIGFAGSWSIECDIGQTPSRTAYELRASDLSLARVVRVPSTLKYASLAALYYSPSDAQLRAAVIVYASKKAEDGVLYLSEVGQTGELGSSSVRVADGVADVVIVPDGKTLLALGKRVGVAYENPSRSVVAIDLLQQTEVGRYDLTGTAVPWGVEMQFNPDGSKMYVGDSGETWTIAPRTGIVGWSKAPPSDDNTRTEFVGDIPVEISGEFIDDEHYQESFRVPLPNGRFAAFNGELVGAAIRNGLLTVDRAGKRLHRIGRDGARSSVNLRLWTQSAKTLEFALEPYATRLATSPNGKQVIVFLSSEYG